jgi:hypothetical protein
MFPDWWLRMSAATGPSFIAGWTSADVALTALLAFAVFFALSTLLAADWPSDIAFMTLVVGGVLVAWPAMIALTLAAIAFALVVGALHSWLAPGRTARIAAEAAQRVAPALDAFARDAGLSDADRHRLLPGNDKAEPPR